MCFCVCHIFIVYHGVYLHQSLVSNVSLFHIFLLFITLSVREVMNA